MARSKGVIRLTGKLGNIVVYELNGKLVARSVPAPKKRTKRAAHSYAKRRGGLEFAAASTLAKTIRLALGDVQHLMGAYASATLTAQLLKVCRNAEGEKGTRPILLSEHGNVLKGFELNNKQRLSNILSYRGAITTSTTPGEIVIHLSNPKVKPAAGATHYRIVGACIALSDVMYVENKQAYQPLRKRTHGKAMSVRTEMTAIDKDCGATALRLPFDHKRVTGMCIVLLAGVEYYRGSAGGYEVISSKGGMQVVGVQMG